MTERAQSKTRDKLIPESAKVILIPALKFGAFTGELRYYSFLIIFCMASTYIVYQFISSKVNIRMLLMETKSNLLSRILISVLTVEI